jgi:hypothetical protein
VGKKSAKSVTAQFQVLQRSVSASYEARGITVTHSPRLPESELAFFQPETGCFSGKKEATFSEGVGSIASAREPGNRRPKTRQG